MRSTLTIILKITCASLLIAWLISTDKLDFSALNKLWNMPHIFFFNAMFWLVGGVFLCSMRWRALVRGMNFSLSRMQAMRLNLIGLFFNTIMPGVVGGDIIKAIYVCKGQDSKAKMPVLLTILLDRIVGLVALLVLSFLAILWNWNIVISNPVLKPFVLFIVLAILGLGSFAAIVFAPSKLKENFLPLRLVYKIIFKINIIHKVYKALRSYKNNPMSIIKAGLYGLVHQAIYVCLFIMITETFIKEHFEWGLLSTVLPIGIITTAIPLAPGGLGIGHLAFEKLFHLIGLSDGANIFNIIFFGQLSLNLLGAIPYLFLRSTLAPLVKAEKEESETQACNKTNQVANA